jgi:hypothetical protein
MPLRGLALPVIALLAACMTPAQTRVSLGSVGDSSFALAVADAPTLLQPGEGSNVSVTVTRVNGSTPVIGAITFSLVSPPMGLALTGAAGAADTTASLALTTQPTSPPGKYTLSILGVSDGRTAVTQFDLEIGAAGACMSADCMPGKPQITSISIAYGPVAGGQMITLTGLQFLPGPTIAINGVPCAPSQTLTLATATCVTPAAVTAGGPYDVTFTNGNGQFGVLAAAYEYALAPAPSGVSPAVGPASGSNAITVSGAGFRAGMGVKLDGADCTGANVINAQTAQCTAAAHAPGGAYAVDVTNLDGQKGTLAAAYSYGTAQLAFAPAPNPLPFGPTNVAASNTLTLVNSGVDVSSAISLSVINAPSGVFRATGAGGCVNGATTLAPAASCTVDVQFLAGTAGVTGGTHTGSVQATAAVGGTTVYPLRGVAAYAWYPMLEYPGPIVVYGGAASYDGLAGASGACSVAQSYWYEKIADAPSGVQYQYITEQPGAGGCGGQSLYSTAAPQPTLRACGTTSPTYTGSQFDYNNHCFPSGSGPFWGTYGGGPGSCFPGPYIVRSYKCE